MKNFLNYLKESLTEIKDKQTDTRASLKVIELLDTIYRIEHDKEKEILAAYALESSIQNRIVNVIKMLRKDMDEERIAKIKRKLQLISIDVGTITNLATKIRGPEKL
ncbi:MAG TPA: hypothetical protein ENG63_02905 [Candidatus Desulfofervidus auxilii]|uniref:Uncharacterized protein n=1 Tax=Desulfofervidus auxilii TaxID=1621989 RepID=A0A7C0U1X7_DESA2|nr:hypothetical protein [Candidatus Desulfofervidus auxilii]